MSVELCAPMHPGYDEVLSADALEFVSELHRRFDKRRRDELARRPAGRRRLDFDPSTKSIREDPDWRVAPVPPDLEQRWVEITGPTERKMVINALNSGADGFMADFEDANSPTWSNVVEGHLNLRDAIEGTIAHTDPDGREYRLGDDPATLLVRPRGWHLTDKHVLVDNDEVAGGLLDAGLHLFHESRRLLERGSGPYFYLPKLESAREAALWADVLSWCEEALGLRHGTCRVTVLIETLPAAFQMEEILHALRDFSCALNAGRWDYIFSTIKCLPDQVLPDRSEVKMTVPFMRAYTERLVATCHRRGAHAIGGMAALIPSRRDPEANERALAGVREDKEREAGAGYDGTWVAHPDLVPPVREIFERALGGAPNQLAKQRDDVDAGRDDLLAVDRTPGEVTEQGIRTNVSVGFRYVSFWLTGRGAAAIDGLMEDAATAEISRTQLWQWIHHGVVSADRVRAVLDEEIAKIRADVGDEVWRAGRPEETRTVFEAMVFSAELEDFLTPLAYRYLE